MHLGVASRPAGPATLLFLLLVTAIHSREGEASASASPAEACGSKIGGTDTEQAARILRGLGSVRFTAESYDGDYKTEYIVGVCGNASRSDPLAGVLQNQTTVLGRVNNTNVVKKGDWMMIMLGSGDPYPENFNCSGPRFTYIVVHCNLNLGVEENTIRFIKDVRETRNNCFSLFVIQSQLVCEKKIGGGTIFVILFIFMVLTYIIGGVLYNRVILGAKGFEQIPNLTFWMTVGSRLKDICNRVCCKKSSDSGSSWENLGPQIERDDDSLLPP